MRNTVNLIVAVAMMVVKFGVMPTEAMGQEKTIASSGRCEEDVIDFPYQDTTLTVGERVEDLLSRLTLEEKLSLMEHRQPAIPSLGLPAYSWWNEALHGVGRNGQATVWPMPIALAATFNSHLVYNIFSEVAVEANEKYQYARDADTARALREPTDYTGLTFFTPNINIFRDPRWGRGMETYGEDPYLTAQMGLACVQGLQHCYDHGGKDYGDEEPLSAAACLKHLAVHSGPEGVRHQFDANVSPRDLWTTYLPAFEYIIAHSDVQQVMCGYNRLNGTPCCTNRDLLVDILRNKWHYDGLIVTDCWALNDCWERDTVISRHQTHASAAAAAADAFGSEVDLECGSGLQALRTAVHSGYVNEQKINEHVRRILRTRLRVEMDLHRKVPTPSVTPVEAAAESLVLLKNEDLLPLAEGTRLYLAGPNATDTLMPLGNYNGTPAHTVSLREGLGNHFTLVDNVREAQVIVYAGGINPQLEGEELPVDMPGFHKGDRTRIELPDEQRRELKRLLRAHRPIVLLLCGGSATALDRTELKSKAVMVCWYGGEAMGEAVAATMAGIYDRFGRLPVTFYRSTKQLPDFEDYSMKGRTYRYLTEPPLYPFGYGLNYARFSLSEIRYDTATHKVEGLITRLPQKNDDRLSTDSSTAVVQVYLSNTADPLAPRRSLIGICKIALARNETRHFSIDIDPYWLRQFNEETQEMSDPEPDTPFLLQVGFSSELK